VEPVTVRGAYSAPPGPLAGLRGPTSKGRGRGGNGEGDGTGRRGKGRGKLHPLSRIPGSAPGLYSLLLLQQEIMAVAH